MVKNEHRRINTGVYLDACCLLHIKIIGSLLMPTQTKTFDWKTVVNKAEQQDEYGRQLTEPPKPVTSYHFSNDHKFTDKVDKTKSYE